MVLAGGTATTLLVGGSRVTKGRGRRPVLLWEAGYWSWMGCSWWWSWLSSEREGREKERRRRREEAWLMRERSYTHLKP